MTNPFSDTLYVNAFKNYEKYKQHTFLDGQNIKAKTRLDN